MTPAPRGFYERDSPVLQLLRDLNSGARSWGEVREALLRWQWVRQPDMDAKFSDPGYYQEALDRRLSDTPGSWAEFQAAATFGMIDRDRYLEIREAVRR